MGGYSFRGIEAITAALKPLLAEHGVFFAPETLNRIDTVRTTGQNKSLYVTDVHVQFNFYDLDGHTFSTSVWGQGSDSGDKAVSKAYTSALKSMLGSTFCISDQETDSERHVVEESAPQVPQATEDEVRAVVDQLAPLLEAGGYPDAWKAAQLPNISTLRAVLAGEMFVPKEQHAEMLRALEVSGTELSDRAGPRSSVPEAKSQTVTPPVPSAAGADPVPPESAPATSPHDDLGSRAPSDWVVPKAQLVTLLAKRKELEAAGVSFRVEAAKRDLGPLNEHCDPFKFDGWKTLISEKALELEQVAS
jgi:hypothetical protein